MFYFHQKSTTFVKDSSLAWAPFLKWTNFRKVHCWQNSMLAANCHCSDSCRLWLAAELWCLLSPGGIAASTFPGLATSCTSNASTITTDRADKCHSALQKTNWSNKSLLAFLPVLLVKRFEKQQCRFTVDELLA